MACDAVAGHTKLGSVDFYDEVTWSETRNDERLLTSLAMTLFCLMRTSYKWDNIVKVSFCASLSRVSLPQKVGKLPGQVESGKTLDDTRLGGKSK